MLTGNSIYHVEQNMGQCFVPGELKGYFNDLTLKVLKGDKTLDDNGIPLLELPDESHVYMPTMIFQYGLGAYDLWLLTGEKDYWEKAKQCADWGMTHQQENGAWRNFFYIYPDAPFSAMAQGEGASLLMRVYEETKEDKYLGAAQASIDFMLTDVKDGGVSDASHGERVLLEYSHLPVVLNGWIFAAFGIYDLSLKIEKYKECFHRTVASLKKSMPLYDCGYWSMYDAEGKITSPFYHNLHIAQLEALYVLTKEDIFREYRDLFKRYQNNWRFRNKAFIKKALQKMKEKG